MKNLITLILLITLACFQIENAHATHVVGSDISYKHLGSNRYEITIKFYRSCNGVAMANPSAGSRIKCIPSGKSKPLSLTHRSTVDVTPLCDTASSRCNPSNTSMTGEGIEEHTFVDTINFANAAYADFLNCSGEVIIETGQCCRNSSITTGAANQNYYSYASLNFDLNATSNNSPIFTTKPVFYVSLNQGLNYTIGAIDTIDNDSLSYALVSPIKDYNSPISYSGSHSATLPFSAYWPGGTSAPYSNPNATPPIGIHLDPVSGTLSLTPTMQSEVTVVVIEVTEWRRSGSKPSMIGKTRRDVEIVVRNMGDNYIPTIEFDTTTSPKIGVPGCVSFKITDRGVVPPPPAKPLPADTAEVQLMNASKHLAMNIDSTVVVHGNTIVYGHVCYDSIWTLNGDNVIYLHAKDNFCSMYGESSKGHVVDFGPKIKLSVPDLDPRFATTLYPNPASEYVYFSNPFNTEIDVQLVTLKGEIVSVEVFEDNKISLNGITPGFYFVRIISDEGLAQARLLVR